MDIQAVVQLIGSLGFPIAACCYVFYELNKEREAHHAEMAEITESHRVEMDKITEALHNNTLVMQKLVDTLSFTGKGE